MENGWWTGFKSWVRGESRNEVSAGGDAFDAVQLPPGASTDDEPTSNANDASNADKKAKDSKDGKKSEKAADKSEEETKTDDTVVVVVDGDGDGDGDEDDLDDNPDDDEPDTDDKTKSGGKSSSRGKKKPPMEDKKNAADAPKTDATAPTPAPANSNTATEHPVLTAALAGGIDTEAKFSALQASAKVGEDALASARTAANAAAVASFGAAQPDKIKAAETLVAGTNDLASLNLLTDNWHASAPGGNRVQGANGGKRQTRSNAPATPPAPAGGGNDGGKKPANDTAAPSGGNVYAQYNQAGKSSS